MLQECKYDPNCDLGETSQFGAVVLSDLLANGLIPANLNVAPESFNDIDDPRSIYGRPSDQFEAMSMARVLNARAKAAEAAAAARDSKSAE